MSSSCIVNLQLVSILSCKDATYFSLLLWANVSFYKSKGLLFLNWLRSETITKVTEEIKRRQEDDIKISASDAYRVLLVKYNFSFFSWYFLCCCLQ